MMDAFKVIGGAVPHFEAASQSRRMRGFSSSKNHINRAIEAASETLVSRLRWLYDNEPVYVDFPCKSGELLLECSDRSKSIETTRI